MISFDHVSMRYPDGFEALKDVNFELKDGEMVFLTGPSGAGKSTLLKLITMIERPASGQILFDGLNLNRVSNKHIYKIRREIGVVYQNHRLLFDKNVFENVALPLRVIGTNVKDISRRVRASISKVGLAGKERKFPKNLSSGEQQRVGIARAVVSRPSLLLADEPTGNLDPQLSEEIMVLFEQFNQVGVSSLIATHDIDLLDRRKKRELRLSKGTLVSESK
ncbi:MAG: cell division ATP-binding protein FtsE [Gammaproteobacteria bacterium]|nr:cell division ATP-binding protein FtsE [Gammaproteobacteria bacterium]|tara:strand:- start:200 stop:862 length:663 start_codon:yes stop_codon:yes gene_type:complete